MRGRACSPREGRRRAKDGTRPAKWKVGLWEAAAFRALRA